MACRARKYGPPRRSPNARHARARAFQATGLAHLRLDGGTRHRRRRGRRLAVPCLAPPSPRVGRLSRRLRGRERLGRRDRWDFSANPTSVASGPRHPSVSVISTPGSGPLRRGRAHGARRRRECRSKSAFGLTLGWIVAPRTTFDSDRGGKSDFIDNLLQLGRQRRHASRVDLALQAYHRGDRPGGPHSWGSAAFRAGSKLSRNPDEFRHAPT